MGTLLELHDFGVLGRAGVPVCIGGFSEDSGATIHAEAAGNMRNLGNRQAGFTLIELMITLAIVAILAAAATYAYTAYTLRNNRVAVQTYMTAISGKQQQYLLDAREYALTSAALGVVQPSHLTGKYTVTITANSAATPPTFLITATPAGSQVKDTTCGTMTLNQAGTKTATGSGGVAACW